MKIKHTITIILLFVVAIHGNTQMRIHHINVGQGAATLIEFPCAAILIDAGGESNPLFNSSEALKNYLTEFFSRRGDLNNTLQCVYLTHPHIDHTRGIPVVLEAPFIIKNAVTDGLERGSGKSGQMKLHKAAQDSEDNNDPSDDIKLEAVYTNEIGSNGFTNTTIDAVNCAGVNPVIKVLWGTSPVKPSGWSVSAFDEENNHSLVIRIEYGTSSVLISGDLEDVAQNTLLNKYTGTNLLDADVYLVGHHGSKNGSSQNFVNKITPQVALIGVGDPVRETSWTAWAYGHPNKNILDRLQTKISKTRMPIAIQAGTGAKTFVNYSVTKAIYTTAWDGDVVLETDGTGNWQKVDSTIIPVLVNINTASFEQLQTLPGIGPTKAQAIINFRTTNGNFTSIEQLDNVPGIGPATIDLLRPFVAL